jgi:hypothetical protein
MICALALGFGGGEGRFVGFAEVRQGRICRLGDTVGDTVSCRPALRQTAFGFAGVLTTTDGVRVL